VVDANGSDQKVLCPRCEQDYLRRWVLTPTGERVSLCPECEATWLEGESIEQYTFTNFRGFLQARGLPYDFGLLEEVFDGGGSPDQPTS